MTTPARKPPSRARASSPAKSPASPAKTPAAAGAVTAPRKTSKIASSARSTNGTVPGDSVPAGFRSVVIENVTPELDGGRYAVKREVGQTFVVEADLFKEGHDIIAARVCYRGPGDATWHTTPLTFWDNDRWRGSFELTEIGVYTYTVEAYPDRFRSWAAVRWEQADAVPAADRPAARATASARMAAPVRPVSALRALRRSLA